MKMNEDGKTVAAMDCLVPGIGEIIGGSQREDDFDKLLRRALKSLDIARQTITSIYHGSEKIRIRRDMRDSDLVLSAA